VSGARAIEGKGEGAARRNLEQACPAEISGTLECGGLQARTKRQAPKRHTVARESGCAGERARQRRIKERKWKGRGAPRPGGGSPAQECGPPRLCRYNGISANEFFAGRPTARGMGVWGTENCDAGEDTSMQALQEAGKHAAPGRLQGGRGGSSPAGRARARAQAPAVCASAQSERRSGRTATPCWRLKTGEGRKKARGRMRGTAQHRRGRWLGGAGGGAWEASRGVTGAWVTHAAEQGK
jgi:hypothetical protein